MKKQYIVSASVILVLLGCFASYKYVYLPSNSCVQVLVSATNRITGKEAVFGNPCSVPFWYKDVSDYNPEQMPSVEEASILGTPNAILAYDNEVALLLPMRECDKSYIIERSYNGTDWEDVGTTTFSTYQEPYDHSRRACENSYVDSSVAAGTKKLWYRYGLLDEKSNVIMWSDVGEVTLEEYES